MRGICHRKSGLVGGQSVSLALDLGFGRVERGLLGGLRLGESGRFVVGGHSRIGTGGW